MPASKSIADPTMARCPEVLASSSGDSKVSLPETPDLLGRSALDEMTALSNRANVSAASLSVGQLESTFCASTQSGVETAARVTFRSDSACFRWGLESPDLMEALVRRATDRPDLQVAWNTL